VSLLQNTYIDYLQLASTLLRPGRIRTTASALGSYDAQAVRMQAAYLRMVSIVEAYTDVMMDALFQKAVPTRDELINRLVEDRVLQSSANWTERKDTYEVYHGISLGLCPVWSKLDAGIEVRNVIAHGLGILTPLQRTKRGIVGQLSAVKVAIESGRILLARESLDECINFCRIYVQWLDQQASL
jgi:hypothetical protein